MRPEAFGDAPPVRLVLAVGFPRAQPVDRPLGDAGHDVALHPGEDRAHDVEADQENDDPSERPEVHAGRVEMEAAQQVRLLVLALGPE